MGALLDRKAQILLADLFYVNHLTTNRLCVPLNIGYISSYVENLFGQDVEVSMYKDVALLLNRIKHQQPDIVGFSFYFWNQNLNPRKWDIIFTMFATTQKIPSTSQTELFYIKRLWDEPWIYYQAQVRFQ